MKKSKITKEEWDKRDLTDILNKYDMNVYDFIYYLIEFELPEFKLNYKIKKENCGELVQVGITPRIAASNFGRK